MNDIISTEIVWIGDMRITRIFKNNRLATIKHHVRYQNDVMVLIAEEHRTYHNNGRLKEIWNSEGDFFEFDINGKTIGVFTPNKD